ncbi:hypothetical protein FXO37_07695 [Capsicum annuum]|nr:hypothetical protein FXO37_07695 [Capsicum annuum]
MGSECTPAQYIQLHCITLIYLPQVQIRRPLDIDPCDSFFANIIGDLSSIDHCMTETILKLTLALGNQLNCQADTKQWGIYTSKEPQLIQADTKQWGIYTPKESLRTSPQLQDGKLGNPVLEFTTDFNLRAEYFWPHCLISGSTYRMLTSVCNYSCYVSKYNRDNVSLVCSRGLDIAIEERKPEEVEERDWNIINRSAYGTIRSCLFREQNHELRNQDKMKTRSTTFEEALVARGRQQSHTKGTRGSMYLAYVSRSRMVFEFHELNGGVVYMGNDNACKTTGIGSIKLWNHDGSTRILMDVWYVPKLKKNLISVEDLESKGIVLMIRDGVLKAISGALVMLKGVRKNNLYYYQGSTVLGTVAVVTSSTKKDVEVEKLWHMRFGHAGEKFLPSKDC